MGIQVFKGVAQQRARILGQVRKLEAQVSNAETQLADLRRQLAAFDEVLRAQGVDIDPNEYQPVRPTPRRTYFAHGELTTLCLDALRTARRPLSTVDLLNYAVARKDIVWRTPDDRYKTRRVIKNSMAVKTQARLVVRLSPQGAAHDDVVFWALPEYAEVPYHAAIASSDASGSLAGQHAA